MIIYKHLALIMAYITIASVCIVMFACTEGTSTGRLSIKDSEKVIQELRDSGQTARKNSRFDEAIQLHTRELKIAQKIGSITDQVKALNNIGTNYRRMGMLEDASRYHLEALTLTTKEDDQSDKTVIKNRLMSLNGLGNVYLTMGDLEQADSIFRQALAGEKLLNSKLGQAINLANIGSVKEAMGQEDSAWVYYRYSLAMNKQAQSKLGEALCFSHFGSLHEKKNKYQEAIDEYKHAYEVMADSPDDWHKLEAGVNIAKLYIQIGQYPQAEQFLREVNATATRIHSLDHRSRIHHLYYLLYEKQGNTRAALDNYILSTQFKDSVVDAKTMNQIQNMRVNVEREKNREQLQMLDSQYHTERWVLRLLTVILSLTVLVAVIALVRQKRQQRRQIQV